MDMTSVPSQPKPEASPEELGQCRAAHSTGGLQRVKEPQRRCLELGNGATEGWVFFFGIFCCCFLYIFLVFA